MDKAALVATDFTVGAEILKALDRSELLISVALWLHSPEYEDWRLVLSSRELDAAALAEAYGLVHDTLSAAGISLERTPALLILKMSDPFIRSLRRIFGKAKDVEGMRLGGQLVGDRFIEDAIVYRIR
jgi:hypothetical protein